MPDEARFSRLEARMREAENGLGDLGTALSELARLQARDHETLANIRDVASPAKIQAITNDLSTLKSRTEGEFLKPADVAHTNTEVTRLAGKVEQLGEAVADLKSSTKIIYGMLGATGLTLLSAIIAYIANKV